VEFGVQRDCLLVADHSLRAVPIAGIEDAPSSPEILFAALATTRTMIY
jgi:hypothetical protein